MITSLTPITLPIFYVDFVKRVAGKFICLNFKALSTLATIVAEFGDYSRQCGQGLKLRALDIMGLALINEVIF